MKTGPDIHPPVGILGGTVHSYERGIDPWHAEAFPEPFSTIMPKGERRHGWFALDGVGNQIVFIPDGTDLSWFAKRREVKEQKEA